MEQTKKLLRFFLGIPATVLAFIFIGKLFLDNRETVASAVSNMDPLLFITGILFFCLFFLLKAIIWTEILRKRGFDIPRKRTLFLYSMAEAKRYIPGSIFAIAGRVASHSESIPQKEVLKSIGIEAILLVSSAALISLPLAIHYTESFFVKLPFFPLIPSLVAFVIIAFVFLFFKSRLYLLKYFDLFILYSVCWVLFGLGNLLIMMSISPANLLYFTHFIMIFVASWLVGYLAFITPMGLGVREVGLVFLLSPITPIGIATMTAVLGRIGFTIGELFFLIMSGLIKSAKKFPPLLSKDFYLNLVAIVAVMYAVTLSLLSILRHNHFLSGRFDLGNMTQTVWNTSQGRFFMLTNPDGTAQISRLGVHSDIILVLFAPFYWFWPSPNVLLIAQSILIAMGGIFIYLIANHILHKPKIAFAFSVSYYLNFWIHQQNLFDFHAVSLATGFLLGAFYFLLRKKYYFFSFFLLLALLTKENVFLVSSLFGVYLFIKNKKKYGLSLAAFSVLTFLFLTSYAIPHARGTEHFALSYYSYLGDGVVGVVTNFFVKPYILLSQIFSPSTGLYLYQLVLPAGFLSLLAPAFLLFALPELGIYLLSSNENLRMPYYHYGALIIPFIYISAIFGSKQLLKKLHFTKAPHLLFYYILATSALSFYLYSPLPGSSRADYRMLLKDNADLVKKQLTIIPEKASVSASNNLGAHLSHREKIYVIPHGLDFADYIALLDVNPHIVQGVDRLSYEEIVTDRKNKLYIFKKRTVSFCQNCRP